MCVSCWCGRRSKISEAHGYVMILKICTDTYSEVDKIVGILEITINDS